MRISFGISGLLIVVAVATGFQTGVLAKPATSIDPKADATLADQFKQAFFSSDPDFFQNRSFKRQLDWMFGSNGFTDNEILRDSARINRLYESALNQQVSSDPVVRTRDLPNPYKSSILTSPAINVNQGRRENEVLFEKQ